MCCVVCVRARVCPRTAILPSSKNRDRLTSAVSADSRAVGGPSTSASSSDAQCAYKKNECVDSCDRRFEAASRAGACTAGEADSQRLHSGKSSRF